MRPDSRQRPALADPGPIRLADTVPPPEAPHPSGVGPRPEVRRGPTLKAGLEPMLSLDDLAALLSCSRRLVERMRSAGKIPRPDIHVGRCPRWKPETIRKWIERGGRP
jgi:predicted DNA-binding transcriptional regulator AlpA